MKMKGKYKTVATHGNEFSKEELAIVKLLQNHPDIAHEYWTQVEVSSGEEIGHIDVLSKDLAGNLVVIEVKTSANRVDEAIGQVLRYSFLLMQERGVEEEKVKRCIACTEFYPSHVEVCRQLGIKLIPIEQLG